MRRHRAPLRGLPVFPHTREQPQEVAPILAFGGTWQVSAGADYVLVR